MDEPDPGVFHWVLIESTEDASVYNELEASEGSCHSRTHALRQGTERLMALAKESPLKGPRCRGQGRRPIRLADQASNELLIDMTTVAALSII
ncbi:hypothetical protein QTI17_33655 [Variovorax sp. J31P179]|uniref:hypothetical protein n=1 Tax=Variovorax sp. J31P179 TaxID=3053508 RepID=UPI002578546E|nr:hypothetical protein [Variovorax sp. J31P179]MDM0085547.1 hypothetical protein [Variovorax sp. J31P179]